MSDEYLRRECKQYHSTECLADKVLALQIDDAEYDELLHIGKFRCDIEPLFHYQKIGKHIRSRLNFTLYYSDKISKYFVILTTDQVIELVTFRKIGIAKNEGFHVLNNGQFSTITCEISDEGYQAIEDCFHMEMIQ